MASTTTFGYTDTVQTPKNIAVPDLSYVQDFAIVRDTPDEVILTNRTCPIDQPETIRFGYQGIANVYANTGIDPAYTSVTKRGVSLVLQVNDILRVTEQSADGGTTLSTVDLPISSHLVVRAPLNQYVTSNLVMQVVKRAISSLFATGKTDDSRLNALLRHALAPDNM